MNEIFISEKIMSLSFFLGFLSAQETRPDISKTNSFENVRKTTLLNEMIFLLVNLQFFCDVVRYVSL